MHLLPDDEIANSLTQLLTQQTHYPIPSLKDICEGHRNNVYFAKIGITMQYHTFVLVSEIHAVITPFGKYQHTGVPM
jgi:hypothetical protein